MSQNKTKFPGMGAENDYAGQQSYAGQYNAPMYGHGAAPSPYTNSHNVQHGTVCPGMGYGAPQQQPGQQTPPPMGAPAPRTANVGNGKPVVGFVYSISRTGVGEYWPLHVGRNIIGNDADCDIILGEGTVSGHHANLHVNKMKKPEKIEATISDLGTTNGTLLNDCSVSVARPMECVSGDIITIGENYTLVLILIDTKALGLEVATNFLDVRQQQPQTPADFPGGFGNDPLTQMQPDMPPFFGGAQSGSDPYMGGTVGMNGGGYQPGGTQGM